MAPFSLASDLVSGSSNPVYDGAKVIPVDKRAALSDELAQFESATGWRIEVFTSFGFNARASEKRAPSITPRSLWGAPDKRTVRLVVDPSSPNILNLTYIGDDALAKLNRGWWQELQSRFGNMFFVREEGESAAVLGAVHALTTCLGAPEGCRVVPGLPAGQYWFTFAFSVIGGLVAGFVSKLEPQGIVRQRWVWLLLFSPLWASLFINFGIGPVVSRTSDLAPVLGNLAGFTAGALTLQLPRLLQPAQPPAES